MLLRDKSRVFMTKIIIKIIIIIIKSLGYSDLNSLGVILDVGKGPNNSSAPKCAQAERASEALKGALSACEAPQQECSLIFHTPVCARNNLRPPRVYPRRFIEHIS